PARRPPCRGRALPEFGAPSKPDRRRGGHELELGLCDRELAAIANADAVARADHVICSELAPFGGGNARSSSFSSSGVSSRSRAARFSRTWSGRAALGIATTPSWCSNQASATCAGVTPRRRAICFRPRFVSRLP